MKVGEKINTQYFKENGRELDGNELLRFFRMHGPLFWSWGAEAFMKFFHSCLRFKVNGHHHKGHVYIFLNFMDTFDVYLTSTDGEIKKVFEGIYIDEIFELLDEVIEKIPAYGV